VLIAQTLQVITGDALRAEAKPELISISVGDPARAIDGQNAFGFGQPHQDAMVRFVGLQSLGNRESPSIRIFINSTGSIEEIETE
jgi:hypothetical protein